MARVKRGTTVRAKHNKILKLAKGYRGRNSKVFTVAKEKVEKGLKYAYRDRRKKKTEIRQLWIVRIKCGRSRQRHGVFSIHERPEQSGYRFGS